ncbi:MAG: NADH-quinone oxidoreductase subunit D [Prevotella sp.]|nr:NADH-quinone oxidoreductase subunit D [Prevotella sp.]
MTLDNIKTLEPAKLRTEMESLKKAGFDYLVNLVGMDWGEEGGLGVVYELENTETHATTWLKTSTADRENPMLPTVSDIWQIANIYEREVFDFYGIKFVDHPDMRRIFLREDWVGYPMRKDDKPEEQNPLNMTNEPLADTTTQYILNPDGTISTKQNAIFTEDEYVVNNGPQHPSTHGVLHFRVSLDGEIIKKIDPVLGYIHRGVEKLNESYTYPQTLALTDRLNYLSAMMHRHALVGVVEEALGVELTDRIKYVRTIMDELQRLDSHLLYCGCCAQDLGALTAFLYCMRDREHVLNVMEETTGGRLIQNYYRIGGLQDDIDPNFVQNCKALCKYLRPMIKEYMDVFGDNVITHNRFEKVGVMGLEDCISYGVTGPAGRAAGWCNDTRKRHPYDMYDKVNWREITMTGCDSMDRYLIHIEEMYQSLDIIEQLIDNIPEGDFYVKQKPIIKVPEGQWYFSVEGASGEFGVYIDSKGDKSPWRLKMRPMGLSLTGALDSMLRGQKIADLVTTCAAVDFVIPDIDR